MPAPEFEPFSRAVTLHEYEFVVACYPGWKTSLALYPAALDPGADPDGAPVALVTGAAACSYARISEVVTYTCAGINYTTAEEMAYGWAASVADYAPVLEYVAAEEAAKALQAHDDAERESQAALDAIVAAEAEAEAAAKAKKGKGRKKAAAAADAAEVPADGTAATADPAPTDPATTDGAALEG